MLEAFLTVLVSVPAIYGIGWFWAYAAITLYHDALYFFRRVKD